MILPTDIIKKLIGLSIKPERLFVSHDCLAVQSGRILIAALDVTGITLDDQVSAERPVYELATHHIRMCQSFAVSIHQGTDTFVVPDELERHANSGNAQAVFSILRASGNPAMGEKLTRVDFGSKDLFSLVDALKKLSKKSSVTNMYSRVVGGQSFVYIDVPHEAVGVLRASTFKEQ